MQIDPVLLEILSNKVTSIAEEAGFMIRRLGHSLFVKEAADFGTALARRDGIFFGYPTVIGVSPFLGLNVGTTIDAVPNVEPGDMIITNHPYKSDGLATHTPDIHLVVPYFYDGKLVCYGWSFVHISDVGGKVPGSISPSSSELFQEGFLMPPMKICRKGKFDQNTLELMLSNTRTPEANLGDLKAMIAAHQFAEKRVQEVIAQHGVETFMQAQDDLCEYAALKARDALRAIPDGTYDFWDYLDDDLVSGIPVRYRVSVTAKDGEISLDFTGTDPQADSAFNLVTNGTRHTYLLLGMMMLIYTIDPTIPRNGGVFEAIKAHLPKGSIIHPEFPASVGVRHISAIRLRDVVSGALHKAVPHIVPAAPNGVTIPVVLAEPPAEDGRTNVMVLEVMFGGLGAGPGYDGVDARGGQLTNLLTNPLETVEASAPVIVREFRMLDDSGGPGKWRGGAGLEFTFEAKKDGCKVLARGMDRFRFQPWGVAGGAPGSPSRTILNWGRSGEAELGKIDMVELGAGDTFTIITPGGGGYGDPFERDPEAVRFDVERDIVSIESARRDYGVVITDGEIDQPATNALRLAHVVSNEPFSLGSEREAFESLCDDETMNLLIEKLQVLPAGRRSQARRNLFMQVFPELTDKNVTFSMLASPERRSAFRAAVDVFGATRTAEIA